MAELGALAVTAAKRRPAGDDTAADTRPEREHHEIVDAAPRARAPLADRRRVRVVLQPDRQAEPLAHVVAERRVLERQVHAANDDAALLRRSATASQPDRPDRVVEQLRHRRLELGDDVLLRVLRCRALVTADDFAVASDDAGEDLRAAEVDAECVEVVPPREP